MTKKQLKLLCYLYGKSSSVESIYAEFSMDYVEFVNLTYDLTDYIDFRQSKPYTASTVQLTHQGEAAVEAFYRERRKTFFHITIEVLTLVIATAAFIQGFFILPS